MSTSLNIQKPLITLLLISFISIVTSLSYAGQEVNSYPDFLLSLKKVASIINNEVAEQQKTKLRKGYSEQKELGVSGSKGAWTAELTSYLKVPKKEDPREFISQSSPMSITNYSTHMEFSFLLPKIDPLFFTLIDQKLSEHKKTLAERNKDVSVNFSYEQGQLKITALYTYPKNASSKQTQKRLKDLFSDSRNLLREFMKHTLVVEEELLAKLLKDKLTNLSKQEFILLMKHSDFDISDKEIKNDTTPEGYFKLRHQKNTYHLWNRGDQIDVGISLYLSTFQNPETRTKILKKLEKWVQDNPAKNASSMNIIDLSFSQEEQNQEIIVVANYTLGGNIKGRNLINYLEKFIDDYGEDVEKTFKKYKNK